MAVISGARLSAASLDIRNHYSPRNRVRPKRPYTWYIVLHTTEGGETGSLRKVWRRGETHYFVTKNGRVYRVVDKSKIATHAGRSMWDGHGPIDNYSIGIEVVGYHDRDITDAQYRAVRELLDLRPPGRPQKAGTERQPQFGSGCPSREAQGRRPGTAAVPLSCPFRTGTGDSDAGG
ncbi:MAG: peptidoglycan recognition family protein [Acidobacteriota bacterium]